MKRLASISFCLVALAVISARAQVSLDAAIDSLQRNIQIRENLDRDGKTSAALRILNRRELETKRAELRKAVELRINALERYLARADNSSGAEDRQRAEARWRYLISIRDGLGNPGVISNVAPSSLSRGRIVETDKTVETLARSASESNTRIILNPLQYGDSVIRGRVFFGFSEIAVQIRTLEFADPALRTSGAFYSHVATKPPMVTYRVVRPSGFAKDREDWPFTLRLTRPLLPNQEVRAVSGSAMTEWAAVRGISVSPNLVNSDSTTQIDPINQSKSDRYRRSGSLRDPLYFDPCEGRRGLRYITVHWDTGKVSPSRLKHSGDYCIEVIGANTILYTYLINVEAESPSGNPFDALSAAIGVIKDGFLGTKGSESKLGDRVKPCELNAAMANVDTKATELQSALDAMIPKEENGKRKSVDVNETRTAFAIVEGRFGDFSDAIKSLEQKLSQPTPNCSEAEKLAALKLIRDAKDVGIKYDALKKRVYNPPRARVYEELEETDKTKITVIEMFGHQKTTADAVTVNIAPGYALISASAGALMTKVPARSYHNRVAPDPANPTATQTILSVDNASGTRPALTALLHYNLPFIQKRRLGIALSGGPVYDISGGKAETSKLGLFGGVSLRFSEWLYLTPGFHIGEFADFPEGLKPGQVVPSNIAEPHPVKRYTTRFGFAMTFKVRDLGQSDPK